MSKAKEKAMLKILVADDEDIIRKGIVSILKRELDSEICFLEAENGIEALKLCNEHNPQLVISDIRMPLCDGLNFIKNVTEAGHAPIIIILSGYTDFEYAKSAIKLGVKEYVLKPINKQEFVTTVKGYIKTLMSEKQRIDEKLVREGENKKVTENVKQKLLKHLLNCSDVDEAKKTIEELCDLGICFNNKLMLCAMLQYQVNEENKEYIDFAIKNIADEVLTQDIGADFITTVQYDSGRIVAIFEGLKRETILLSAKQILNKICSLIRKYLNINVFAGIGDVVFGPTLLNKTFERAYEATKFKLYDISKGVQTFSEIPVSTKYEPEKFNKIIQTLEDIKIAEIINIFEKQINFTPSMQSLIVIEQSYSLLIKTIDHELLKYNSIKTESLIKPPLFSEIWSFLQLKQEIIRYLNQVNELACESKIDVPNKKLIVNVLQYVKDNAASDINLNIVAEKFERTPTYMSALFKKGTGMGFNEYVTSIRMNMAKQMLSDTSIPIGEVSKLCGYLNPKYFSVVFKNTFGISPASYRQEALN